MKDNQKKKENELNQDDILNAFLVDDEPEPSKNFKKKKSKNKHKNKNKKKKK